MEIIIRPQYKHLKEKLEDIEKWVNETGTTFYEGRNTLSKVRTTSGLLIAVKSFKVPHLINRFIYGYFRAGKAYKSYHNALKLIELGINTPAPVAFIREKGAFGLGKSYYISEYVDYKYMFRDLIVDDSIAERNKLISLTAKFTLSMQDKGVFFKDHSSGNTLLIKTGTEYDFMLVDINRITFKTLNLNDRYQNFSRLTNHPWAIKILAKEAASHLGIPEQEVYSQILKRALKNTAQRKNRKKIKKVLK